MPIMSTIGIDYGGKRIGIAVSESNFLATPYRVIANHGDDGRVIETIALLGEELEAELYILGLPKRSRSTSGEQKYVELAEKLRQRTCKAVELWDETLSTVEAAERLRATGRNARKAKSDIDMHAAAVILQSYLDHQGRTS
jgi:putative Holliday junction resolvase